MSENEDRARELLFEHREGRTAEYVKEYEDLIVGIILSEINLREALEKIFTVVKLHEDGGIEYYSHKQTYNIFRDAKAALEAARGLKDE